MDLLNGLLSYFPENIWALAVQFGMALIILIIGWVIAKLVSSLVWRWVSKMSFISNMLSRIGINGNMSTYGSVIKNIVFIVIFLYVLVAFFGQLGLESLSNPLNSLVSELPKYLWVAALACFTWIASHLWKTLTSELLLDTALDTKTWEGTSHAIGTAVYGFIILFFLPGILGWLGLQEIVAPIEWILDQMIGYVPNILGAGIILVVWVFVARLVKQIISSILKASKIDDAAGKLGMNDISLSNIGGTIVYVFIMIPLAISALDKLQIESISWPATEMLGTILNILPNLIGALALIALTYVVANFASKLITDLLKNMGFDSVLQKVGLNVWKWTSLSNIAGKLILTVFMLFAVVEAGNMLWFTMLSDIIGQFIVFGGTILGGLITISIGLFVANLASNALGATSGSKAVSGLIKIAIITLSVAIGLWQMGIADDIINLAFGLLFGAIAVAFALAVGLGSRDVAARELDSWLQSMKK